MSANDERKEDQPLYSRLFVVCSKQTKEHELRQAFDQYGVIEDLFMPRNRNTGEAKGIAFIKYNKTSSAAAAIKALNLTSIGHGKTIKVMVAASKNDSQISDQFGEQFTRLFVKVPRDVQEQELSEYFSQFGALQSVLKLKDKMTGENRGFAYITYKEFYDAAKAFEECDKSYKPIFATPKDLKRARSNLDNDSLHSGQPSNNFEYMNYRPQNCEPSRFNLSPQLKADSYEFKTVLVVCSPIVAEKFIYQLMNIIPGLVKCQYSVDEYNGLCKSLVTYEDAKHAAFAIERINKYEFPSGEIVTVKPDTNPLQKVATDLTDMVKNFKTSVEAGADLLHIAEAIEKASSLIKAAANVQKDSSGENTLAMYCNVPLPPLKPLANNTRMIQRLFIVCKPEPPPLHILEDAFCRFGDFISVSLIPKKNFGFVKYASSLAAKEAMRVLHGATLCGMYLKVLEADERPGCEDTMEPSNSSDNDSKRMKYDLT